MKTMKKVILLLTIVAVLGTGVAYFFLSANTVPKIVKDIQTFSVYYPKNNQIGQYRVDQKSIDYSNGVLVYTLVHTINQKQVIVTEQPIPKDFAVDDLKGDQEFKNSYGKAFITDGMSRTTGALFSDSSTWILLNAPKPIGADDMKMLINTLSPLR
jgi:hypothetical protein